MTRRIGKTVIGEFREKVCVLATLTCDAQLPISNVLIKEIGVSGQREKGEVFNVAIVGRGGNKIKWPNEPQPNVGALAWGLGLNRGSLI